MPRVSIIMENGETKEIQAKNKGIIYDAADNEGIDLPHGCLAGSCGACRIEVTEGAENLTAPSAIEENTICAISDNYKRIHGEGALKGKTIRLSCRAKVTGDVTIKIIK